MILLRLLGYASLLAVSTSAMVLPGVCSCRTAHQSTQAGGDASVPSGSDAGTGGVSGFGGSESIGRGGGAAGSDLLGGAGAISTGGTIGTGGVTTLAGGGCDGACAGGTDDAGVACANVVPCGGDVVGTWVVTSSCLKVTGERNIEALGLTCRFVPVTGSLQVTGTWTATSDGTFSDDTITSGDEQITVGSKCVESSGTVLLCPRLNQAFATLGYASASCLKGQTDIDYCTCLASVDQEGGVGLVAHGPPASGEYTTSGDVLTTDTGARYSYCVSANTLTLTPVSTSPVVTGTIVLRKQ